MRALILSTAAAFLGLPVLANETGVAGSDGTNDLGYLLCAAQATATPSRCPYEMLRKADGTATLRVLFPGGRTRSIYFEGGEATGTDSTDTLSVDASLGGDVVIFIGAEARIEVPAAVLEPES